jgi:FdhE protein
VAWGLFSKARSQPRARETARHEWPVALRTSLADLERLIAARPELEPAGRPLARVLVAAFGKPAAPLLPPVDDSAAIELALASARISWEEGQPALHSLPHTLDGVNLAERILSICAAIGADGSPAAGRLHAVIERQPERVLAWVKLALQPAGDALEQAVRDCGLELDATQVGSVLRLAMLPALAAASQWLCTQLTDATWPHGICPVCGSAPALAESRGLEQRRHLRCDRCAADWPSQHFLCPFCGMSNHRSLRYVFVEGEQDRYRLAICDDCGGRLKIIATIAPLSPPGLLVAELAAVHLDLIDDSQGSLSE